MQTILSFDRKQVTLMLAALQRQIAEMERADLTESEASDFGNDIQLLRVMHSELRDRLGTSEWNARVFHCFEMRDGETQEVTVIEQHLVEDYRARGWLGAKAQLRYSFPAATVEEASAIHFLRQGFGGYTPIGEASPCPTCAARLYPLGSGECWKCGLRL